MGFTRIFLVCGVLLAAPLHGAFGQSSPTMTKIRQIGIVTIGFREASVPFSYLDSRQKPVGYSIDLCLRIADTIKAQLKLADLEYKMVPVTSANRLALVASGTLDMECGSTTNNLERQHSVSFLLTTFVASTRLLSRRDSPVTSIRDLRGKTVVSTAGTTSIDNLRVLNQRNKLRMQVLAASDHAESFSMVETGRASAFLMDDVLLYGLLAQSPRQADFLISDEALSVEPYAIVVRKDDPEFKRIADQALMKLFETGEILRIYEKWFESAIPGAANLRLPMSSALRRAIAKPLSSGDPKDYR